jgi:hypothetical protein
MKKPPFHLRIRVGRLELELGGDKDEVLSVFDKIENIVEKVSEVFEIDDYSDFVVTSSNDEKFPIIEKVSQCSSAIEAILNTEWGETPRSISELMEAMKANEIHYPKTTVSGVLYWMVQKNRLRRWKEKRGYLYVLSTKAAKE